MCYRCIGMKALHLSVLMIFLLVYSHDSSTERSLVRKVFTSKMVRIEFIFCKIYLWYIIMSLKSSSFSFDVYKYSRTGIHLNS